MFFSSKEHIAELEQALLEAHPDQVIPGSDSDYAVHQYEYDRFGNLTK
jgi:hypothetical protein